MRQLLRHYEKKTNQKMAIIFNAKINKSTQNILVYINIGMYCSRYVKLTGLVSDPIRICILRRIRILINALL